MCWMYALLFMSAFVFSEPSEQANLNKDPGVTYTAKDFQHLKGMQGFSSALLDLHFTLYQGYVKNTNLILQELDQLESSGKMRSYDYGALKRRLGWEFDGMRLHELYFENLGGKADPKSAPKLMQALESQYGSFAAWKESFIATGMMRGIGWVILYIDPMTKKLVNTWINEHDVGHLATCHPLLVMDVWEHAYITEYGLNREQYIQAFFKNIDWVVVNKRYLQR